MSELSGVPEGWRQVPFGELAIETQLGTTQRGVEEGSTSIPLIKMGNLTWGGFALGSVEELSESKLESESLLLRRGDFLFNTRNTPDLVGKSAVWHDELTRATFDNNINRIRLNSSANPDFVCAQLTYGQGKKRVRALNAGSTSVAAIYWKDLKNLRVYIPPLEEQHKIADILSTWDEAIEQQTWLLELKRERKRGLMQQLLTGKVRFKEFEGLEWTTVELGSLLSHLGNGLTYDTQQTAGVKVTRIETISTGTVNALKVGYTSYTEELDRYRLRQGDILYSHINSLSHIGKVAYFDSGEVLYHGMNLLLLRANENTSSRYLYYLLTSRQARKQALVNAKSAVNQASINTTELRKFTFLLPSLSEQRKIAAVLSAADAELETLETQLSALRTQKRGLMQQLLTGKTRVSLS